MLKEMMLFIMIIIMDHLLNIVFIFIMIFQKNNNYTYDKKSSNQSYLGFNRDYEFNNGEQNFSVAEIEVFQIILE